MYVRIIFQFPLSFHLLFHALFLIYAWLVAKIQELACARARSEKEIHRHLKIFVQRIILREKSTIEDQ